MTEKEAERFIEMRNDIHQLYNIIKMAIIGESIEPDKKVFILEAIEEKLNRGRGQQ